MKTEIENKLKEYITKNFFDGDPDSLTSDTQLLVSGIIDSISALEIVDFIEENFDVQFEAHEVDKENLSTISTLSNFIITKKG
ncbi:acyl carrier protein [Dokdonia ponticola]|uniref:Acyl carrier protein n=1 Tax=Dokdonia ponticola TaxID=2041041 RepID=A0ABV9HVV0_9FLAO